MIINKHILPIVRGTILGIALTGSAFAQSTENDNEPAQASPSPPNNWAVNCSSSQTAGTELVCQMVQNVIVAQTQQRILSVVIRPNSETNSRQMTLALPHGLDFTNGVAIKIDEQESISIPVRTSNQQGAFAIHQIDEDLLSQLQAGDAVTFSFNALNGQVFNLQLSLVGFTAAYEKLGSN